MAFFASRGITVTEVLTDNGPAYRSESARRAALSSWLHIYNHHRPHTALGGKPPVTCVINDLGQTN